jgi:hypothetical protein
LDISEALIFMFRVMQHTPAMQDPYIDERNHGGEGSPEIDNPQIQLIEIKCWILSGSPLVLNLHIAGFFLDAYFKNDRTIQEAETVSMRSLLSHCV